VVVNKMLSKLYNVVYKENLVGITVLNFTQCKKILRIHSNVAQYWGKTAALK
jgi:hypothetical protein